MPDITLTTDQQIRLREQLADAAEVWYDTDNGKRDLLDSLEAVLDRHFVLASGENANSDHVNDDPASRMKGSRANAPSAQQLFDYAMEYQAKAQADGAARHLPTVREAAEYFRCFLQNIIDAANDSSLVVDGYLGLVVAVRGGSGGIGQITKPGDQMIEAYR